MSLRALCAVWGKLSTDGRACTYTLHVYSCGGSIMCAVVNIFAV